MHLEKSGPSWVVVAKLDTTREPDTTRKPDTKLAGYRLRLNGFVSYSG